MKKLLSITLLMLALAVPAKADDSAVAIDTTAITFVSETAATSAASAKTETVVTATSVVVDPIGIDLSTVFGKLRGGTLYTFVPEGMTLATLYAPVVSYHDDTGLELVNLNAGAALNTADGKGSPLFSIGIRADGLLQKSTAGTWAQTHITTATLPPIELAATTMWYAPQHIWTVGLNLAVRFSE